jgi:hypothetical protein
MATPTLRRSARIAAMTDVSGPSPPPAVEKPSAKQKKREAAIAAHYNAMTPEQKTAEYKKQTETIEAAKKIVVDISNPAIPFMPDAERIAVIRDIIKRMNDVWSNTMERFEGGGMDIMFITDARRYSFVVSGDMDDFMNYANDYDDDLNEIKVPIEMQYARYCKDAAKTMNDFIDTYRIHTAISP